MITGISVKCEVTKGTFASEYFVRIKTIKGDMWGGFVNKELVLDLSQELAEDSYVNGRIYAYLISFNEKSALIELPIEDSTSGRRILVPIESVRKEEVPA